MSSKKFKPLGNHLLIKRSKSDTTKRLILLPDSAKEKPNQGEVISTGTGKIQENGNISKMEVKIGDKVLFAPFDGNEVYSDDEEFLIISEDDILAILE
jgi:chaperonin GroES